MLNLRKKFACVVVSAALACSMVPASALAVAGAGGGEGASGAAAALEVAATSDAAGEGATSQDVTVTYSEGMETDGVLIVLDTAAVDADDSALQTLCADESAEVAAAAQDVAADAASDTAGASIEALADLAQAVVEDEGLEVSDQVILDDGTAIVEVAVDDAAQITTYSDEGVTTSSQSAVDAAIDALKDTPGATVVQPNFVYELLDNNGVSDPYATDTTCWWLDAAGFSSAWKTQKSNNAVTVAVLDSGIMVNHEDLNANILTNYAYDSQNKRKLLTSVGYGGDSASNGHGTHVSGIISAVANNATGIAGGSYNANILPIKVLDDKGSSSSSKSLVVAYQYLLKYADTLNIRVVNMSLGAVMSTDKSGNSYYPNIMEVDFKDLDYTLASAIDTAKSKGIVTVCAGGNYGSTNGGSTASSPAIYPGDYENCVSVMATDASNTLWSGSDDNQYKDIAAPGVAIYSADANTGKYKNSTGSSMAAPMVSAAFALLFTAVPGATVDEACTAIYKTASTYNGAHSGSGCHGALNTASAITYLRNHHAQAFSDVALTDYYAQAADYMLLNGIMTGVGSTGKFMPNTSMTRAQFALMLWRMAEPSAATNTPCADTTGLRDIKGGWQWYSAAANWAYKKGLITGVSGVEFQPDEPVTCQDMLVILARYNTKIKGKQSTGSLSTLKKFTDGARVGSYAQTSVAWAVEKGIIEGYTNSNGTRTLGYSESITRGRGAQIIYNAIKNGYI